MGAVRACGSSREPWSGAEQGPAPAQSGSGWGGSRDGGVRTQGGVCWAHLSAVVAHASTSLLVEEALAGSWEESGLELVISAQLGPGIGQGSGGICPQEGPWPWGRARHPTAIHLWSLSAAGRSWGRWPCWAAGSCGRNPAVKVCSHPTPFSSCLVKQGYLHLLIPLPLDPPSLGNLAPSWPSPSDPPDHF